jgi:ferredoxin
MEAGQLQALFEALKKRGYRLIGPTVRDGVIASAELDSARHLPWGWTDEQEGGIYRLKKRGDRACFAYAVGPHSWKQFLFPPEVRLWKARQERGLLRIETGEEEAPRLAFIGVRACELSAIAIQDRVFMEGPHVDPVYKSRRENLFIVALNCTQAGGTCFCASMGSGPQVENGHDLALTEVVEEERHYFLLEVGSQAGALVLEEVPHRQAEGEEIEKARGRVQEAARRMGRRLDPEGLKELLYSNLEHPRWQEVASRCLSCANCTLVCPTCFCHAVEDTTDLKGEVAERWRRWDSCFALDFSYIHGGSVRRSTAARYRQWLTHKLAAWIDQFGTSGCVGCGRCITWCPVGIDLTAEVHALRVDSMAGKEKEHADA